MKKKKLILPCTGMFLSASIFGLVLATKDASNSLFKLIAFIVFVPCYFIFVKGVLKVDDVVKEAKLELMDETFYPAFIAFACGVLGLALSWMIIIPFTHFKEFIQ